MIQTAQARMTFEQGDRGRAHRILRDNLVADAVHRIDADPGLPAANPEDADARQALTFMRDVLDTLTADAQPIEDRTPAR